MPTVCRRAGLRVVIHTNDHRPAHVHIIGADAEAVFVLRCPLGPVELRHNYSFRRRDVQRIKRHLVQALPKLCAEWRGVHGHY